MLLKPIIKFNAGNPVALCNKCRCIMCYVSCSEQDLGKDRNWVVREIRVSSEGNYISTPIGKTPPIYCDKCNG